MTAVKEKYRVLGTPADGANAVAREGAEQSGPADLAEDVGMV